jgi:hypothetical protein
MRPGCDRNDPHVAGLRKHDAKHRPPVAEHSYSSRLAAGVGSMGKATSCKKGRLPPMKLLNATLVHLEWSSTETATWEKYSVLPNHIDAPLFATRYVDLWADGDRDVRIWGTRRQLEELTRYASVWIRLGCCSGCDRPLRLRKWENELGVWAFRDGAFLCVSCQATTAGSVATVAEVALNAWPAHAALPAMSFGLEG